MRTITALGVALLGSALALQAQDYGMGMSLRSDSQTLLFPMKLKENFMMEPSIGFFRTTSTYKDGTEAKSDSENVALGLFWTQATGDSTRLYAGPRLGYAWGKTTQTDSTFGETMARSHGWAVTPTLGFEYFPIKHLSLGGEIGLTYAQGGYSSKGFAYAPDQDTRVSTTSSVLIRYYF